VICRAVIKHERMEMLFARGRSAPVSIDHRERRRGTRTKWVREAVAARPEGYLPVGASCIVATGHERIPYMIVAPTMISPEFVEPQSAYRAMRAVLRVAMQLPFEKRRIYSPGLCTGVGGVAPAAAAIEMATAYTDWLSGQG
jgi:O-acetyl-ADP-ribose deacetylase (regulator of RNase III)